MKEEVEKPSSRQRTLGWLAETAFLNGTAHARKVFEGVAPGSLTRSYSVIKPGDGQAVLRTDVEHERDGIEYVSFSPPASWEARYSVALVTFRHVPKADYLSHGGEELIVPVSGSIVYHFYWSGTKLGDKPHREVLKTPLKPESIARINPQIPHHTWAATEAGAVAWMIFHHFSEVTPANLLDSDPEASNNVRPAPPRRIAEKILDEAGRYALVAWGIAEKIRLARARANLSIAQLARACNVDSSLLSRLENADSNVSVDTLVRISQVLHLDLVPCIAPDPWHYEQEAFPKAKEVGGRELLRSTRGHILHPAIWTMPAHKQISQKELAIILPPHVMSTWIVLHGRLVVDLPGGVAPEILGSGSVLHLRSLPPHQLHALEDTRILQLHCLTERPLENHG